MFVCLKNRTKPWTRWCIKQHYRTKIYWWFSIGSFTIRYSKKLYLWHLWICKKTRNKINGQSIKALKRSNDAKAIALPQNCLCTKLSMCVAT